ncbi:MAG TPA: L,D-transpeptidase, partial [Rhizomicrobium sp.]
MASHAAEPPEPLREIAHLTQQAVWSRTAAGLMRKGRNRIRYIARALAASAFLSAASHFAIAQDTAETPTIAQSPGDAELDSVEQRLNDSLSTEMLANFSLFLYVDKAEQGPLAQRMYVFEKTDSGDLALLYDWPVSTGREGDEIDPHGQPESTATPRGFFELDPKRLYVDHASSQWDEAMPYAMFFNWKPNGRETGLAIHGTPAANEDALGTRASAGCVRLATENARVLFDLVRSRFRGPEPKLAYLDDSQVS